MLTGRQEALPFGVAGPPTRQVRVDVARADRIAPADEVAGVPVVDIEPVERVGDLRRALFPGGHVVREPGLAPTEEPDHRVDFRGVGRAFVYHRNRLAP